MWRPLGAVWRLVWLITVLVATVEENRPPWLLLGLIVLAGRGGVGEPEGLDDCFPADDQTLASGLFSINL